MSSTQTEQIIELFQTFDIQGMRKQDIYTKIEIQLDVPRPTVRRAINMFLKNSEKMSRVDRS
jgi:hypothetical protein